MAVDRSKLYSHLKSKYGAAADGGKVEDDESDTDDTGDSEPSRDEPEADASTPDPSGGDDASPDSDDSDDSSGGAEAAPSPAAAQSPGDVVRASLAAKYGAAADPAKVEAAKAAQQRGNQILAVTEGLEGAFRAQGQAHGGQGVSEQSYQNARQGLQNQVTMAEGERQRKIADVDRQFALEGQLLQHQAASANLQAAAQAKAYQQQLTIPGSPASLRKVAAYNSVWGDKHPLDPKTASGADAESMLKSVGQRAKVDATSEAAKGRIQAASDAAAGRRSDAEGRAKDKQDVKDKVDAMHDFASLGKDVDSDLTSSRSALGVAQNKINSAKRVFSAVQIDPSEIEAARKDPAAKAALSAKLNALGPQQYAEVVTGLMATVSPGSGNLGQFEHLRADTADQTFANVKQYFSNNPEAANAGPLIEKNLESLGNEIKTGQKMIDDHAGKMRAKHPYAFSHPDTSAQAEELMKQFNPPPPEPTINTGPAKESGAAAPTKVIGGVTYSKIPGGWQAVK